MEWSSRGGYCSLPSLVMAVLAASSVFTLTTAQCPWPRELSELNGSCLCAFNLQNELSIQCTAVNFTLLMTVLHQRALTVPLDLLYINNTRISVLNDRTFDGLAIENIQFSSCGIFNISTRAFQGLEDHLKNLNLQDNRLSSVPTEALERLRKMTLLDLSGNKLTNIPENAFKGPKLATLKLAENEISLSDHAFGGLETSLKNLNLKGTKLHTVPLAIRNLPVLAFLDLAQNQIKDIEQGSLSNLHSLTALNLERNLLQALEVLDFQGVNDTLSSLSLLNNLITDFPDEAFHTLSELRVLDIGFNLITRIPSDGFRGVRSLTLLALDGNPLTSVPGQAFSHLNNTLRGLSVGGRFLHCDCKVAWIADWIRDFDLQVTSRERNPQFCGSPPELRERSFYQLNTDEFKCNKTDENEQSGVLAPITNVPPKSSSIVTSTPAPTTTPTTPTPTAPSRPSPKPSSRPSLRPSLRPTLRPTLRPSFRPSLRPSPRPTTRPTTPLPTTTSKPQTTSFTPGTAVRSDDLNRSGSIGDSRSRGSVERPSLNLPPQLPPRAHQGGIQRTHHNDHSSRPKMPNLVRRNNEHSDDLFGSQAQGPFVDEVIVQDAYRKDNSVIIQWDSEVSNILGFRVVYRLFGDKAFKLGPPLAASEREFKIKNVPTQECIVVCVVSLEDVNITPENVENGQCREIRTEVSGARTHMDTIIIAASAAICGTVIIAVIVFICCNRKRVSRREKDGIPAVLSPASPPLASLGTLGGGGNMGKPADWDTISMYSQRSIPRARMYHMDKGSTNNGFIPDDVRSHISRQSSKHIPLPRSMADGQSQRSYSALSARNLAQAPAFGAGLQLSRPDLRMSHQSLAASQFGSGTMGHGLGYGWPMGLGVNQSALSRAASTRTDRTDRTDRSDRRRQRSKSRERERAGSRMSHAGSTHSLTGYDTDNWTDHDMDIYMARNPTKGGLVQL